MMKERFHGYQLEPTESGWKFCSRQFDDLERTYVCALFPDCSRKNVYNDDELVKMDLYSFRPIVFAGLSPHFNLDLHGVLGMAGYGRIAVTNGKQYRWLDEFAELETEYVDGTINYYLRDSDMLEGTICVSFSATAGAAGMVGCIDCRELDESVKVYLVYGGVLGWSSPQYRVSYVADMCWNNMITLQESLAEICLGNEACEYEYTGINEMQCPPYMRASNAAWNHIENWEKKVTVRADGARMYVADPTTLIDFSDTKLNQYKNAKNGVVCAELVSGKRNYIAVGRGKNIENVCLKELYEASLIENQRIARSLVVNSGDTALDGAVRLAAFSTNAIFGDNVLLHGAVSWRGGYLGWRSAYGPLAYNMISQVYCHFDNHLKKSHITTGPDKGSFMHMIETAKPDSQIFWNMSETFIDQAKHYLEYTGDSKFAKRLLAAVEGCIEHEIRRLKPGEEWLFENSLNTWISDGHWTIMGQCTQASAYMYNMMSLASELSDSPKKKAYYADLSNRVKADMQHILWQKRKGVFAYAKELRGNKLLHPEPELPDIYFAAELGVADRYQIYQMLDWIEANLPCEYTDNGGKLYWSSNWHPNTGDSYTHSTYELAMGEEMNLALVYFQAGMAEKGYEIFKTAYMSIYGGRDPGIVDHDRDKYIAKGYLPILTNLAGDFSGHISINGTPRRCPQFADAISMFGRALYEGMLGIRPKLQKGEIWLSPSLPEELPCVDISSGLIDYRYERGCDFVRLNYTIKRKGTSLMLGIRLPVAEVRRVEHDGMNIAYTTESDFDGIQVKIALENTESGCIYIQFMALNKMAIEERRNLIQDESIILEYPGEMIEEVLDPQGLLKNIQICKNTLSASVQGDEGSGVIFLRMKVGESEYIRPVKLNIAGVSEQEKLFRGVTKEFEPPYQWSMIQMDELFTAASPLEVIDKVRESVVMPPEIYSQVNANYYKMHLSHYITANPTVTVSDQRWRSLVDKDGIAMTGEGIPFRSKKEGAYMAPTTLAGTAYPASVTVPVADCGRAAYLLVTGMTFPMQSHVENVRVTFTYEDDVVEEYPLVNPMDIGDMWFPAFGRYHDTPANGFENMNGNTGELSSVGLDLRGPIPTDTEAHIIRFVLREGKNVKTIRFTTVANDAIFALMGVTLLK